MRIWAGIAALTAFVAACTTSDTEARLRADTGSTSSPLIEDTDDPDVPAPWGDVAVENVTSEPEAQLTVLCDLSGAAGSVVDCPIMLVRETEKTPAPVAFRGDLFFPVEVQPIALVERVCAPRPGLADWEEAIDCDETLLTSGDALRTGHTMVASPEDPKQWDGAGRIELAHPTAVDTPLPNAWLIGSTELAGVVDVTEAQPLTIRFRVRVDIPDSAPARVSLESVQLSAGGSNPVALKLGGVPVEGNVAFGGVVAATVDCTKTAGVCDDGSDCTKDYCDPKTGSCQYDPQDGATCSDGNACTKADLCRGRECRGDLIVCDDGDACTVNSCDAKTGCKFSEVVTPAPPGLSSAQASYLYCPDHVNHAAAATACLAKGRTLATLEDAVEAAFVAEKAQQLPISKQWWIGLTDAGVEGTFVWSGSSAYLPWTTPPPNTDDADCVAWGGNLLTGATLTATVLPCGENRPFVCKRDCDDLNPCTSDVFDAGQNKCVFTPNTSACEDGDLCTTGDACLAGACVPGKAKSCDDGNACTTDTCTKAGECKSTLTDVYQRQGEVYAFCKQASGWTAAKASCEKLGMGLAILYNASVNDEIAKAAPTNTPAVWWTALTDATTEGTYQWDGGGVATYVSWAAGEASGPSAQAEDCVALSADVAGTPGVPPSGSWLDLTCTNELPFVCGKRCDDSNPCTFDQLDSNGQCVHTPAPFACDDKNPCTTGDFCDAGKCLGGAPATCNDVDPCTTDACDPVKGCLSTPAKSLLKPDGAEIWCTGPLNWFESQTHCRSLGGLLTTYVTAGQTPVSSGGYWTSVNDLDTEGTFFMAVATGNVPPPYFFDWPAGQPANTSADLDCAFLDSAVGLQTSACNTARGFTCAFPAAPKVGECESVDFVGNKGWVISPKPAGTACDDKDMCTGAGSCQAGVCTKGAAISCDDKNPCTEDTCRPNVGCEHKRNWIASPYAPEQGYLHCKTPMTFEAALNACEQNGMDLFYPDDEQELLKLMATEFLGKAGTYTQTFHANYTDSAVEGTFKTYKKVNGKRVVFDVPAGFPARACKNGLPGYSNNAQRDHGFVFQDIKTGVPKPIGCMSIGEDQLRAAVCETRCTSTDARDWPRFDGGTCFFESRMMVRPARAAPQGVPDAQGLNTAVTTFRVMPPATFRDAQKNCGVYNETPAPWWVGIEAEAKSELTTRFGITNIWTSRSWRRPGRTYSTDLLLQSLPSSPTWQTPAVDSGWGITPALWCGFQPSQPLAVAASGVWPTQHFGCGGSVCPHPYPAGWNLLSESQWWSIIPRPASGPASYDNMRTTVTTAECRRAVRTSESGTGWFKKTTSEVVDDCWSDACVDASVGSCANIRSDCLAKRPYLCQMGTAKWNLGGGQSVTAPFHPCGACHYYDPNSGSCRLNTVQLGAKTVISCTNVTPITQLTDFRAFTATDFGNYAKACAAASWGPGKNLPVAKLSQADAMKVHDTLSARQFQGNAVGIGPYFSKEKYQEFTLFDDPGENRCTLVSTDKTRFVGGNPGEPCVNGGQVPGGWTNGKAVIYRVLCEQICPGTKAGPCATPGIDEGMNCTGISQEKPSGSACDDGDPCTTGETCNATGQCLSKTVTSCGGDACNPASCVPGFGCVSKPLKCDDKNSCTTDSCQVVGGKATCVHTALSCPNDGNACTIDTCVDGKGCYQPRECNDLNPCTTDSCDPTKGCAYTPDPDAAGSPGCGSPSAAEVKPTDPKCATLSGDKKRLTIDCLPGGRRLFLDASGGKWIEANGKAQLKDGAGKETEVEYKRYTSAAPVVLVNSPSLKLPGGIPGIPLPGAVLRVAATNPPSIEGSLMGLPGIGFGALQGFGSKLGAFPESPLKLAFAPAKFLQEKYFDEDDPKWCKFDLPQVKQVCDQLPKPPKLPLPEDSMWFSIVWDASSMGVDFDLPGLDAEGSLKAPAGAIKKKALAAGVSESAFGRVGVLFDPFDPGLYVSLAEFPMLSKFGIEAGALGLSWNGNFELESILPVRLVTYDGGGKKVTKGTFKAVGNLYAMATVSLIKFLKLPLVVTGELLVGLDPNRDGPVLVDTVKKMFRGEEVPGVAGGTDRDFSLLGQARLDVKLGFGDIHPKLARLGEIAFTIGKAVLSMDTRPNVPQSGLRFAGRAQLPQWPGILGWANPEGEAETELWFANADTFGFEITGVFRVAKFLSDLAPTFNGHLVISTDEIKIDAQVTFFGQNLAVNGWMDASTGAFELCTSANIDISFGPLPSAKGRACFGSPGIQAEVNVNIDATIATVVSAPIKVLKSVGKTVQEWVSGERNCKWYDAWCWANKFFSYVVDKIVQVLETIIQWIEENLSIGARLQVNLNALFPFGGVPDIGAKVTGQFVWPGGSFDLGSFGAKVSNGGLTIYLPNPVPTICLNIKALSVSKGACP